MTELTLWLQLMGKKYKSSSISMSMYTNINLTNLGMLSCLEVVHKSGQALAVSVPTNNNTCIYILTLKTTNSQKDQMSRMCSFRCMDNISCFADASSHCYSLSL